MKQYKAVFLDWDNTIGDFSKAAWKSLQEIYTTYQLQRWFPTFEDYHALYHTHNLLLWDLYGEGKVTKDYLQFDRFAYPLYQHFKDCPTDVALTSSEIEQLAKAIGDDFCRLTTEYFSVLPHAAEVVRYLAQRYPLTIVSNGFVEVQYEKIQRSGLADCFAHIVLSEEVGIQKPNPLIFEKALELNGMTASETIMIGDTYSSDIVGAQAAGIDQIWITNTDFLTDNHTATYIVADIAEVQSIL
ncbi:MAG: YjjG family noncanonical pyrimidine nucleotidase [Paludibacter sp.]|nr:YjjG family noncanonical pyrimidine nucleotidase [Bacteroidales bacterium]MCM1069734.1 YjjG family noncanonical pyrimidine nucleotidase [Prevotella sp.]MCM1354419.1 YjjG family noncanonical pyrimidine nucleotidase [Bacteroides sp.]MCM1443243.1 YjjG family noncanonical pyrimidine nucleotidase [Muribaculum sp.]MCM1482453.1 YjjG family noncanonical pyrimidine nucleotidase [Paludibacter sp.]